MRVVVLLLLCAAPLLAQDASKARYRLLRYSDKASTIGAWWEDQRVQDILIEDVVCNLPAAEVYTTPGFRIADPDNPGMECQWTAPLKADVFASMQAKRTYTFYLKTRPDIYTPWSAGAELAPADITQPGRPSNGRIVLPPGAD